MVIKYFGVFLGFLVASLLIADTKVAFDALPVAVQVAAKTEAKGAEILGASKEVEKGQISYEIETKFAGKSRDLNFDQNGKLLAIEEEATSAALPPAAWAAIQKRAAGGAVKKIDSITQGKAVSYEAVVETKSGKNREIAVNADGTLHGD